MMIESGAGYPDDLQRECTRRRTQLRNYAEGLGVKVAGWAALAGGILLAAALIGHYGLAGIVRALEALGWRGFAAIVAVHVLLIATMGIAWWVVTPPVPGLRVRLLVWGRLVRDSVSEVLPLSQVGGFVAGSWAITRGGLPAPLVAASTIVDVTAEAVAQLVYAGIGLVLLDRLGRDDGFGQTALAGLLGMAVLLVSFVAVQKRGLPLPARFFSRLPARWLSALSALTATGGHLRGLHARRGALVLCCLMHLATWIGCGLQIWLALRLMGISLGVGPVLVLESLLYGARSIAFFVPNAVGVQEGAYVALASLIGLSPEAALALSLLKRGRDLAIGVPVLLAWQAAEGHRALRRFGAVPEALSVAGDQALATEESG
jgi:putative membrane protein